MASLYGTLLTERCCSSSCRNGRSVWEGVRLWEVPYDGGEPVVMSVVATPLGYSYCYSGTILVLQLFYNSVTTLCVVCMHVERLSSSLKFLPSEWTWLLKRCGLYAGFVVNLSCTFGGSSSSLGRTCLMMLLGVSPECIQLLSASKN
jgi:hypothetical protein